ncbi:MAG: hypothetical protein RLZZ78_3 [Armatimonadota bacterium]
MRLPVPMGMLDLCEAYHFDALLSQPKVEVGYGAKQNAPDWVQSAGIRGVDLCQEWLT